MNVEVVLKAFDQPDERREFELGTFELVRLGGLTIGRATYQPGWQWSRHVGKPRGERYCTVEHVGLVLSGVATAAFEDGNGRATWASRAASATARWSMSAWCCPVLPQLLSKMAA